MTTRSKYRQDLVDRPNDDTVRKFITNWPEVQVVQGYREIPGSLLYLPSDVVPVERVTSGVPVIDTNHAQIHASNAFSFSGTETITPGSNVVITMTIPVDVYVHFQAFDVQSDGGNELTMSVYEGATITADGTAMTPINRHRVTPTASSLTVEKNPTVSSFGILIDQIFLPKQASGNTRILGTKSDSIEWVFAPGTTYAIILANNGTVSDVIASIRPFWYEEGAA